MNDQEELKKLIDVCTLCGSCNSSCPVFDIELAEPYSPRGKINLIKEYLKGNIQDKKIMNELITVCLICGYCQNSCSKGVNFKSIFAEFLSEPETPDNESIKD